jgi:protein-S-isoprenylcysteine O-methyltransferase Ste14
MSSQSAVLVLWVVWYSTWVLAVVWSRKTKVQMGTDAVGLHRALTSIGAIILFSPNIRLRGGGVLVAVLDGVTGRLWPANAALDWAFVALTVTGFAFCWWARLHLGTLWSGFVTLKDDHRIIDTGPYALVRHPIYSGVIFAALMTALLRASPAALVGFCLVAVGFTMIARVEETFLRQHLGAAPYEDYSRRVSMLIPGVK